MTMPASQPVDYVAWLTQMVELGSPEYPASHYILHSDAERASSLAAQLMALREAGKGCGHAWTVTGGSRPELCRPSLLCPACLGLKLYPLIAQLTHTNPRDAHGR